MKKLVFFLFLLLLILIPGCITEKPKNATVIIQRPGFLRISIIMNTKSPIIYVPPEKDIYPLEIAYEAYNYAEFPSDVIICLDGLSEWKIEDTKSLCKKFRIDKSIITKNKTLPAYTYGYLTEKAYPPSVNMTTYETIVLNTCHSYNTSIYTELCLYFDENSLLKEECFPDIYSPSSPLVLQEFKQVSLLSKNDSEKKFGAIFIGKVKYEGKGIIFNYSSFRNMYNENVCYTPDPDSFYKMAIYINKSLVEKFDKELKNFNYSCQDVVLNPETKEAIFYCKFNFTSNLSYLRKKYGPYVKVPIYLVFRYAIFDKISREIILKPLVK